MKHPKKNQPRITSLQRLALTLWPYWLGFTLGHLILWPFDITNGGVLIGLYLGSIAPLLRYNTTINNIVYNHNIPDSRKTSFAETMASPITHQFISELPDGDYSAHELIERAKVKTDFGKSIAGRILHRMAGQVINGRKFERVSTSGTAVTYRLQPIQP